MHVAEAFHDTLAIIGQLGPALGGVTRLEVQRGGYMACLLALYDGRPLADWGYRFARTEFGTPFSPAMNDAVDNLHDTGRLGEADGRFRLELDGESLRDTMLGMTHLASRRRFIDAACGSALIVPPATFSEGLDNEPTVRRALHRDAGGGLLDGPALSLLYDQFEALSAALGRVDDDLIAPSVVWLSYIAGQGVSRIEGRKPA